jgi:transposase
MMRPVGEDLRIYLHRAPVDMRKGRHGLAALAREVMQEADVFSGALFIFIGRRYDTLKILYWEKNGFAIWHKKIETEEKYHWPRFLQEDTVTLSTEQLNWLLDGYDIWAQPHRTIKFAHAC